MRARKRAARLYRAEWPYSDFFRRVFRAVSTSMPATVHCNSANPYQTGTGTDRSGYTFVRTGSLNGKRNGDNSTPPWGANVKAQTTRKSAPMAMPVMLPRKGRTRMGCGSGRFNSMLAQTAVCHIFDSASLAMELMKLGHFGRANEMAAACQPASPPPGAGVAWRRRI